MQDRHRDRLARGVVAAVAVQQGMSVEHRRFPECAGRKDGTRAIGLLQCESQIRHAPLLPSQPNLQ
jgi:hypothetical protein